MQKQNTFDDDDDLISLADLVATVWYARWLILAIAILTGIGAAVWSLKHATYSSHGFFQFGGTIPMVHEIETEKVKQKEKESDKETEKVEENPDPGIGLADFKRYAVFYGTVERFADYVQEKKLEAVPGVSELHGVFGSRDGTASVIEPVHAYSKVEASGNNVIGLRILYETHSPQLAQQMTGVLGRYVMDSIIYFVYSEEIHFKRDELKTSLMQLDNTIITNKVALEQHGRNVIELKKLIARNPAAANHGVRQVVTISPQNVRYLPPLTLLMAAEVQTAEANEAILRARRQQLQNTLLLEYYDRAKLILDQTKSGESVLRALEPLKVEVFKNKDLHNDDAKKVYNTITIDNQKAAHLYLDKSRFIAGPTFSNQSSARPVSFFIVGTLVGLVLTIFFAFARKWWRENQEPPLSTIAEPMRERIRGQA